MHDVMEGWKVLGRRYLLKRWWMTLRVDHVRLPDGAELPEFHVIEYPDWVCVVCLDEANELVMVEQYRHGIEQIGLEFPAGAIDEREDPLQAGMRELREETGYSSDDWVFIGRCAPEPSKHTHWAYIYLARNAGKTHDPATDHGEHIRIRKYPPRHVFEQVAGGNLVHGTHLLALLWANRKGLLPL